MMTIAYDDVLGYCSHSSLRSYDTALLEIHHWEEAPVMARVRWVLLLMLQYQDCSADSRYLERLTSSHVGRFIGEQVETLKSMTS